MIAIVGTAGTTDLGAIDPLDALADAARRRNAHFHVDAAVGSGLTPRAARTARRLKGIERADSVTADLHKLWWMPFGASALLVPDVGALKAVHHASVYLNRPEDEAEGQLNLVGRSLDTSRRFDALKVLVALKATGRHTLEAMVDHVLALAQYAGEAIDRHPHFELVTRPQTVMVAFRHTSADNIAIHRDLFDSGQAVIGRTTVDGRPVLKLTLLNPNTTPRRHRRAARADQRGSRTGSLTVRDSPVALRTVPVIQTVLSVPLGLVGRRRRRDSSRLATSVRFVVEPRNGLLLGLLELGGQAHLERAVLIAREPDERRALAIQLRRRARGQERRADDDGGRRRARRARGRGARHDEDLDRHDLGVADAVADLVGDRVLADEARSGRVALADERPVLRRPRDDHRQPAARGVLARRGERRPAGRPASSRSHPGVQTRRRDRLAGLRAPADRTAASRPAWLR